MTYTKLKGKVLVREPVNELMSIWARQARQASCDRTMGLGVPEIGVELSYKG